MPRITPGGHHEAAPSADAAKTRTPHQPGYALTAHPCSPRRATRPGYSDCRRFRRRPHGSLGSARSAPHRRSTARRREILPSVEATRRHHPYPTHHAYWEVGLVPITSSKRTWASPRSCRQTSSKTAWRQSSHANPPQYRRLREGGDPVSSVEYAAGTTRSARLSRSPVRLVTCHEPRRLSGDGKA